MAEDIQSRVIELQDSFAPEGFRFYSNIIVDTEADIQARLEEIALYNKVALSSIITDNQHLVGGYTYPLILSGPEFASRVGGGRTATAVYLPIRE